MSGVVGTRDDDHGPDGGYIGMLSVDPALQGRGEGRALMAAVMREAVRHDLRVVAEAFD